MKFVVSPDMLNFLPRTEIKVSNQTYCAVTIGRRSLACCESFGNEEWRGGIYIAIETFKGEFLCKYETFSREFDKMMCPKKEKRIAAR